MILETLRQWDRTLFVDFADPRTQEWFLIRSPYPGLAIIAVYLFFCNRLGPQLMQNRKPFQLRRVLIAYNLFQVAFSAWILYEGRLIFQHNMWCEPIDTSMSPRALQTANATFLYYIAKYTELLDTVFFVLRKKDKQITFLHLYHHTTMLMASWGCVKYLPGGHSVFIGYINTFVHVIMYGYYLLAALGPHVQKYLWWKKYITVMQMVQFLLASIHASLLLFNDCGYPRWTCFLSIPNAALFYVMFKDFYVKAYNVKNVDGANNGHAHAAENGVESKKRV